jgi:hypothetical protein
MTTILVGNSLIGEVVEHDRLRGLPPCSSSSKVQIEVLDSIGSSNLQAIRIERRATDRLGHASKEITSGTIDASQK